MDSIQIFNILPQPYAVLFAAAVLSITAFLLSLYLAPTFKKRVQLFVTRHFFGNKYDYRELWVKFSETTAGSLSLNEILPKLAGFIADSMYVRQVTIWLRSASPDDFYLAYSYGDFHPSPKSELSIRMNPRLSGLPSPDILRIPEHESVEEIMSFPLMEVEDLKELRIRRMVPVRKNRETLGWVGIGEELSGKKFTLEDEQFLLSISNQLAHLILMHRLSEELLVAREWEPFNRLTSFVIHDLKNLATQQSMTLENAKNLGDNRDFVQDAFDTFAQTTDKMISLIASLSVRKGHLAASLEPANILEVLKDTFDDLKICQREGVKLVTEFPREDRPVIVYGDPNLLRKAFTNILLNAIQSLPNGEGTVQVAVSHPNGKVMTAITDTGCGIRPEILRNLFRPFQTTKKGGTGIGLCHTRSIVEVHGGQIRIESRANSGTKVEIELPAY
ncbi:MAG: ATP-binding protein [Deltaproteobacteria bacterium]|nr:ATP-binding protein [Deltaproteobacteria bacterium]